MQQVVQTTVGMGSEGTSVMVLSGEELCSSQSGAKVTVNNNQETTGNY